MPTYDTVITELQPVVTSGVNALLGTVTGFFPAWLGIAIPIAVLLMIVFWLFRRAH